MSTIKYSILDIHIYEYYDIYTFIEYKNEREGGIREDYDARGKAGGCTFNLSTGSTETVF